VKRDEVFEFYRRLAEANPAPTTELEYTNPYTLLVAVVLSAQATDASVNIATRDLFARCRRPSRWSELGEERCASDQDHRPVQHQGEERHRAVRGADRAITAARSRADRERWRRCPASAARPPTSC
jgi:hypothetical protein